MSSLYIIIVWEFAWFAKKGTMERFIISIITINLKFLQLPVQLKFKKMLIDQSKITDSNGMQSSSIVIQWFNFTLIRACFY